MGACAAGEIIQQLPFNWSVTTNYFDIELLLHSILPRIWKASLRVEFDADFADSIETICCNISYKSIRTIVHGYSVIH
jgi:hypothetical protein